MAEVFRLWLISFCGADSGQQAYAFSGMTVAIFDVAIFDSRIAGMSAAGSLTYRAILIRFETVVIRLVNSKMKSVAHSVRLEQSRDEDGKMITLCKTLSLQVRPASSMNLVITSLPSSLQIIHQRSTSQHSFPSKHSSPSC
jgi:hypothetical protein